MRFDLGLILGVFCEFISFVYYANSTFYSKKDSFYKYMLTLMGYTLIFVITSLGYIALSVSAFFIINLLLFLICYEIDLKNAIFQCFILDFMSVMSEYIILWLLQINLNLGDTVKINDYQSLLLTVSSKIIYFIGILALKNFVKTGKKGSSGQNISLIFIPVITLSCIMLLSYAEMNYGLYLVLNLMLLSLNFLTFIINERVNAAHLEVLYLRDKSSKNMHELESYRLMAEKYEQTRILRHDFKEQIKSLQELINEDNVKAKEFADNLSNAQRQLEFNLYTDNNILNILLERKIKECHDKGIELHIHSTSPSLDFITDIDTVAIFSNLINNAMEGCEDSEEKNIFMDFDIVNNGFVAVKIENNCDKNPILYNGRLTTKKDDKEHHGIGLKSVRQSLKKYDGNLDWSYDSKNKFFRIVLLINIPEKNN